MMIFILYTFQLLSVLISQDICQNKILSELEKSNIVKMHNYYRSQVAMGIVENQPPARNINILTWDEGLADEAQLCAEQCQQSSCKLEYGHISYHTIIKKGLELSVNEVVKHWFNKHVEFNPQNIKHYQPGKSPSQYTQLVWATSYLIGCGQSIYEEKSKDSYYIVCYYYPPGNIPDQVVYQIGTPGQACGSKQIHHPGLCVPQLNNGEFKNYSFSRESYDNMKYFQYSQEIQQKQEIQDQPEIEVKVIEDQIGEKLLDLQTDEIVLSKTNLIEEFDKNILSYQQMKQK